jgi:membrane fusion protein (multidrug efflux system)
MKKLLYIPAILFLAACSNKPKDKKAELADLQKQQQELNAKITKLQSEVGTVDSTKAVEVAAVLVKTGTFANYVQIQGKIDAQDNVTAFSQSPGTITALYVKPGQHVSKGQVLAQLDASVLQQQIAQTEANLDLAKTVYDRQKNLWDQKIGTEVQFLQAQTNYKAGLKSVAALRSQANLYRITSPISGTVDQMDLKLGQALQPGQAGNGIRIVNADVLKVKADVPESYAGSVNTGNQVQILVPDAKDSLTTTVSFASKAIDPTSRSFAVEIKLPHRASLRPNMTAIIKIANYTKNDAIAIPVKAVQRSETGDYVFVNEGGIARQKNVKLGITYGGQAEILSGLKGGEELITEGAADIEDGDKVKATQSGN